MPERTYTEAERRRLEAQGETGYGESFPLDDCDAVRRAIDSYGRAPVEKRPELRRRIVEAKVRHGCEDVEIPSTWRVRA